MSTLVKSLYRLYHSTPRRVTEEKLLEMIRKGTITEEDYLYITDSDQAEEDQTNG